MEWRTALRSALTCAAALLLVSAPLVSCASTNSRETSADLALYREELTRLRGEYGGSFDIPDAHFLLFGMGLRTKYLYKEGVLTEALTGKQVQRFDVASESILPPSYRVDINTKDGKAIAIVEDERGVWIIEKRKKQRLPGTDTRISLPQFADKDYPRVLRVLHQEVLVNILPQGPVPNFFVYPKPWYRDSAMMGLVLQATGNVDQIRPWIMSLREPYDRNNRGEQEADNLGQALFLVSLVSDARHPLVQAVLAELPKFETKGPEGLYIKGRSDFSEHPVYQTKWLKFGLRSLGMKDPYTIPRIPDTYSRLFWMDYRNEHVRRPEPDDPGHNSPYLGWATDHFYGTRTNPISNRDYPLTWEYGASQAAYPGIKPVSEQYVERYLAAPHTWHSAEVFLYLFEGTKAKPSGR